MRRFYLPILLSAAMAASAGAQAISGVGAVLHPLNQHYTDFFTDLTTFADGPRLVPSSDGGIWFLEANADRIAFFKNDVITEWPIRLHTYKDPFRHIGANPADFEVDPDGHTIWFIENGNSGIDVNESVFAKLDTSTNVLTEWVMPVSKPAGFFREADGKTVWIAMSQGSLVRLNLETLEVDDNRASDSDAYSGMILGPDGFLYLSDFGDNRIVKVDRQALTETSWTVYNPALALLQITQPTFDTAGNILVAEEVSGGSIGQLNPSTGVFTQLAALSYPSHFLIQEDFIYVVETDPSGGDGAVVILNKNSIGTTTSTIAPATEAFRTLIDAPARIQSTTLTPDTFQSNDSQPDAAVVASSPAAGISVFTLPHGTNFPQTTSYSIAFRDGKVLMGVTGALVEFTLLPPADPEELVVPLALNEQNSSIRTDFVIAASKKPTVGVTCSYYDNPVPPPPAKLFPFTAVGLTSASNQLGVNGLNTGDSVGSLRFSPDVSDPTNAYSVATRTYAVRPSGATYGFSMSAQEVGSGLSVGTDRVLFLGSDPAEISTFGIYAPTGASGTATLHGPGGGVRGTYTINLPANNRVEFNPAFDAFGVSAEPGDYVTFSIVTGNLFPYSAVVEASGDAAVSQPIATSTLFDFPVAGAAEAGSGFHYASDVLFVNPSASRTSTVTATLHPFDQNLHNVSYTLTIPPGAGTSLSFGLTNPILGSLLVESSEKIAALERIAHKTSLGDYTCLAPGLTGTGNSRFLWSGDTRLTANLALYNRGGAGFVSVEGFDTTGKSTGKTVFGFPGHSPAMLVNVPALVGLTGAGTIEVRGLSTSPSLFAWMTTSEKLTGDPDVQPPFLITP